MAEFNRRFQVAPAQRGSAFVTCPRSKDLDLIFALQLAAADEDSLGTLHVSRSVWRSVVNDPKTTKSKAPVPVISQLAGRLAMYREMCGNPSSGPILCQYLWAAPRFGRSVSTRDEESPTSEGDSLARMARIPQRIGVKSEPVGRG
jgi:hypothetical protein